MKRIICTCLFLAALSTGAMAQNAVTLQSSTAEQEAPSISSKVNELKAYLSRDSKETAEKAFFELMDLLTREMSAVNGQMETATEAEKTALTKTMTNNRNLMGELKPLSADLIKNKKEVVAKLDAFMKTR